MTTLFVVSGIVGPLALAAIAHVYGRSIPNGRPNPLRPLASKYGIRVQWQEKRGITYVALIELLEWNPAIGPKPFLRLVESPTELPEHFSFAEDGTNLIRH